MTDDIVTLLAKRKQLWDCIRNAQTFEEQNEILNQLFSAPPYTDSKQTREMRNA